MNLPKFLINVIRAQRTSLFLPPINITSPLLLLQLLLATANAMGPLIRRFISLGLNRVWLKSGDLAYRQGERSFSSCTFLILFRNTKNHCNPTSTWKRAQFLRQNLNLKSSYMSLHPPPIGDEAECLYVVISGRLRLMHEAKHPVTGQLNLITEEEVGRGEAVGAVWTISGLWFLQLKTHQGFSPTFGPKNILSLTF